MSNKNIAYFSLGLLIISFCLSENNAFAFKDLLKNSSVCSFIDGSFYSKGNSDYSLNTYFSIPLLERNVFRLDDIADASNIINIKINQKPLEMHITVLNEAGNMIAEKVIDSKFECEPKKIIFESSTEGGGDGSSVQLTKIKTEFYMVDDMTLAITVSIYTESRSWIFFRDKNMDVINYTFQKASLDQIKLTKKKIK